MDEEGNQFVAYFLPVEETLRKRKRDQEEEMDYAPEDVYGAVGQGGTLQQKANQECLWVFVEGVWKKKGGDGLTAERDGLEGEVLPSQLILVS